MNLHVKVIDTKLKYNWKDTWHEIRGYLKYRDI